MRTFNESYLEWSAESEKVSSLDHKVNRNPIRANPIWAPQLNLTRNRVQEQKQKQSSLEESRLSAFAWKAALTRSWSSQQQF